MISKKLYTLKVNWGFSTTRLHTSLQHSSNQDKSQFQSTKFQLDELTWIIRYSHLFIIVLCSEISCNGRGDCLNLAEGGFTCICHEENTGAECEYSMYSCHLDPCHNNENCTVGINGTVSCLCHPGWTGQFCSDGLLLNEFTLIIISIFIRYPWLTKSVNLIVWVFNKGFKNKFMSVPGTNNLANSYSFSITLMQLPIQTWIIWVRNDGDLCPIFTSFIYVVKEPNIVANSGPTWRLASLGPNEIQVLDLDIFFIVYQNKK